MVLNDFEGDATELVETYGKGSSKFNYWAKNVLLLCTDFLMKFIIIGNYVVALRAPVC